MKHIEDIRAGNIVYVDNEDLPVIIIEVEQSAVLLKSFPVNSYRSKKYISGIPLTTQMLHDLNFNDDKIEHTWSGQGITIHLKEDGIFYGLRLLKSRAKIQYLHQLQNYLSDYYIRFKDQERSLRFDNDSLLQHISLQTSEKA